MMKTMIHADGLILARGRDLAELPEPCFCDLYQISWSTKTHRVKRKYEMVKLATFSEFMSLGLEETQSRVLKMVGDGGILGREEASWSCWGCLIFCFSHQSNFLHSSCHHYESIFPSWSLPPRVWKSWSPLSLELLFPVLTTKQCRFHHVPPCQDRCWDWPSRCSLWLSALPLSSLSRLGSTHLSLCSSLPSLKVLPYWNLSSLRHGLAVRSEPLQCCINSFKKCLHRAQPRFGIGGEKGE